MLLSRILRNVFLLIVLMWFGVSVGSTAEMPELYFVDAHSQMAKGLDSGKIIALMDKAGVRHTIISARNDRSSDDVADFAAKHPERITAAVRSKGKAFNQNRPELKKLINSQLARPEFKALAETILYHAQKGKKAPKIIVEADDPQVEMLLNLAKEKSWPFIAHYEFSAASRAKGKYLQQFEGLLQRSPDHPFLLIHMGQLDIAEVERLIAGYDNLHFMMSHCNPVSIAKSKGQPWTNLFKGEKLAPRWLELIAKHPERFVLAFDNVWPEFWGKFYLKQASLWRKALADLPSEVAHAVAHGNAERLWNLPEAF